MNSNPRCVNTGTVTATSAAAPPITDHFHRNDQRTTGFLTVHPHEDTADDMRILGPNPADDHHVADASTRSTSGNCLIARSLTCTSFCASPIAMPGIVVGM